jgi:hypothetical protein
MSGELALGPAAQESTPFLDHRKSFQNGSIFLQQLPRLNLDELDGRGKCSASLKADAFAPG